MKDVLMDIQLFNIVGRLLSCMITVFIVFRYFDSKYCRLYDAKIYYAGWRIACCCLNLIIYFLDNPAMNLSFWILVICVTSKWFYYDETMLKRRYYITNVSFMISYGICESIGAVLVNAGVQMFNIKQNDPLIDFVYTIGGSAFAILFYYLVLKRLFVKGKTNQISMGQYMIYIVIMIFVIINIGAILFFIQYELDRKGYIFFMTDACFVILLNLYVFYLLDAFAENKELKYKLDLYERQAKSNYAYYAKQAENRTLVLSVLHDVEKHIRVLEELKQREMPDATNSYLESFEAMISPLNMSRYCNNTILNIIINDKMSECRKKLIQFHIEIIDVNIDFMKQIDITTIFGNILDNAVEACEKAKDKRVYLKIHPFNGFIYVSLSNTFSGEIKWDAKGRPVSCKGKQHGIGLENVGKVLSNYNGNIQFSVSDQMFIVEIMFSSSN